MTMTLEDVTLLPRLTPRADDANKGDFGKVLVVAGSRGMSGAAVLCGSAALRGGAGLVRVAIPECIWSVVAAGNPCYTTAPLPNDDSGRLSTSAATDLLRMVPDNNVFAVGPGLGRGAQTSPLVQRLYAQANVPMVLDADGLNAFAAQAGKLKNHAAARVLTPHPGEFARLVQSDTKTVQAQRRELAARFAADHSVTLVLKGHGTIVTDGRRIYQNKTGNPGMATGGTGDVLTGLIAALIGQRLEPFAAAQLGVHVHGLAGDLARDDKGVVSLIASDLLDYLPRAFARI
jgi:ADP-dependent NAD(P)H-hydrate dehydratase